MANVTIIPTFYIVVIHKLHLDTMFTVQQELCSAFLKSEISSLNPI